MFDKIQKIGGISSGKKSTPFWRGRFQMVKKSISGISKQYYVQFHLHKHPVSEFSLSLEIVEHNT